MSTDNRITAALSRAQQTAESLHSGGSTTPTQEQLAEDVDKLATCVGDLVQAIKLLMGTQRIGSIAVSGNGTGIVL
jgi:predicted HAD superfamily phosphohydrolase